MKIAATKGGPLPDESLGFVPLPGHIAVPSNISAANGVK